MKSLALIIFLYMLGRISAGPCGDISLSNCLIGPGLIDVIDLPDGQNAISQCQTVCASVKTCNFFRYDHRTAQCYLLSEKTYQESCERYSGPGTPTLDQCFSGEAFEDLCDAFTFDDCTFEGEVVLEEENVNDLEACENLMVVLGDTLGATVFEFDGATNNNCKLYKSADKSCQTFSGPSTPEYADCGTATTSITSTTFAPSPPGPNIQYGFCSEGEQPLEILNAWISPFPLVIKEGGTYDISLTVVLKKALPANSQLDLKWIKTGIIDLPLPCLELTSHDIPYFVGSCVYDINHLLNLWEDVLEEDFHPIGNEWSLPLEPGVYGGTHTVHLPDEFPDFCIVECTPICEMIGETGSYRIEARTLLEDGTEFGCVTWSYEGGCATS